MDLFTDELRDHYPKTKIGDRIFVLPKLDNLRLFESDVDTKLYGVAPSE